MDKLLYDIMSIASPSGKETRIQKFWAQQVKPYVEQVKVDVFGNVYAIINPHAKRKILISGHCDEIGFIVSDITDEGFIKVDSVGGISPKLAVGMSVIILGDDISQDIRGVVGVNAEHLGGMKTGKIHEIFIDCGFSTKKDAMKCVTIGDYVVYDSQPHCIGESRLAARGFDNRSALYMLAQLLRRLHEAEYRPDIGIYIVSSICEEIGGHGAYSAAAHIQPDIALAIDVTFATDHPHAERKQNPVCSLGKGPVLACGSTIHPVIYQVLCDTARQHKISVQHEITVRRTGTDADMMKFTGIGVPIGLVSLPLRYMHSPREVIDMNDVNDEIDLLFHSLYAFAALDSLQPFSI